MTFLYCKNIIATLALLASVLRVLHAKSPHAYADDLITETCKKTPQFDLCKSILQGHRAVGDVKGLALIIIGVFESQTVDARNHVDDLMKHSQDPNFLQVLSDCKDTYQFLQSYSIVEAVSAVKLGDPKFGEEAMNDAVDQVVDGCESRFLGRFTSPLAEQNQRLQNAGRVAAAIIKILE
ncbi:hypothetical protein Nepgr_005598 [Nepenthes gracilis]|uniref:Pectinesterase inhibitor domain-containing protein n=1 Tax=Nepenthes gracilis TaxID=150966 RepID=A0AAD3S3X5_NEPGR|nr:hypothetical protein Nepgr_005598 [Nepenthes gracilis]